MSKRYDFSCYCPEIYYFRTIQNNGKINYMTTSTPKRMALYIALLSAVLTGAAEMLFIYTSLGNHLPVIVASVVMVFIIVYFLVWLMLSDFIFQKINPIYNTISKLKKSKKSLQKQLEERDMADNPEESGKKLRRELDQRDVAGDLNREMESWASDRDMEIDQLKELELFRKEFLGNVSHELKTPIFNVQGYILTLLDGGIDDPAINKLYLERAEKSINRLINIVGDLDTISRLDSGEIKLEFGNFDIVDLVSEVFELQEMRAQKAGVKLKFKNRHNKPILVHADRLRIQEALINLVVNSVKYSRKNGQTTIDFTDMEDRIMVEVADNGLGIPNEDLPRIFERFYRVDKSRSRNQGGTGLGLAIVKHVVEAHNQQINVRSKLDKGTVFTFTLMKGR